MTEKKGRKSLARFLELLATEVPSLAEVRIIEGSDNNEAYIVVSDEQYSRKLAEERREKPIIDDGGNMGL
jgi:hypothetical protein